MISSQQSSLRKKREKKSNIRVLNSKDLNTVLNTSTLLARGFEKFFASWWPSVSIIVKLRYNTTIRDDLCCAGASVRWQRRTCNWVVNTEKCYKLFLRKTSLPTCVVNVMCHDIPWLDINIEIIYLFLLILIESISSRKGILLVSFT